MRQGSDRLSWRGACGASVSRASPVSPHRTAAGRRSAHLKTMPRTSKESQRDRRREYGTTLRLMLVAWLGALQLGVPGGPALEFLPSLLAGCFINLDVVDHRLGPRRLRHSRRRSLVLDDGSASFPGRNPALDMNFETVGADLRLRKLLPNCGFDALVIVRREVAGSLLGRGGCWLGSERQ